VLRAYTAAAVRAAEQPLLDAGRGPELMRRAAHGLAMGVRRVLRERGRGVYGARVVLLIGSGNNGGDALFAGAHLAAGGARTTALLTTARTHPDALAAFLKAGGRVVRLSAAPAPAAAWVGTASKDTGPEGAAPAPEADGRLAFLAEAGAADVVVDGLLGTGGRGGLREPAASVVARLCEITAGGAGPSVVACDVPSGVDASTGEVHGPVLAARLTVTFGAAKTGLLCSPGEQLCGEVEVVDIGLGGMPGPPDLCRLETADLAALLPHPEAAAHKYTRGVAGIIAGSARYPGAALLAVAAASACGPGMVTYLGDVAVSAAVHLRNPEVVCSAQQPGELHVQAWLAGPGIDGPGEQLDRARAAIASGLPTVVDAGALGLVGRAAHAALNQPGPAGSGRLGDASHAAGQSNLLLTPHAGELSALFTRLGTPMGRKAIEAAPLAAAREAARITGATVLLKGPTTVVAAPNGTAYTQADGTASLATAGSGDTLGGILVALLAMGAAGGGPGEPDLARTAALGAALHGRLAREAPGQPLNAGVLAARIPVVWAALLG